MNRKIKNMILALFMLTLFMAVTACRQSEPNHGQESTATGTEASTKIDETTPQNDESDEEETTMTQETTFEPDPALAVPQYDALLQNPEEFPFHFTYDGTEYTGFLGFEIKSMVSTEIQNGIETVTQLTHPDINAIFSLISRVYPTEKAYEYVVYIDNVSDKNTGVFKNPEFIIEFEGENAVLSGLEGDAGSSWYQEYEKDMTVKQNSRIIHASTSGRPTHVTFPYYNLSFGTDDGSAGTFIAIGWPGTWRATFSYRNGVTTLTAGQNKVATYLAPGETLRTPLMAFVTYEGMDRDSQANAWRHYFIQDVMHRPDGELPQPVVAALAGVIQGDTTQKIMNTLKMYEKNGIRMTGLWLDAGWYVGANGETVPWPSTGTQEVDISRFPDKLSTIGSYCKERGMEMLLWFEPENIRLDKQAFLASQEGFREEWLLDKTMVGTWLEGYLLDMGNADARAWLFEKVCKVIDEAGVTVYRQDFNSDPAASWAKHDGPDRTGMTENQYVQGYLAYWDALLEKYPYLMIDSCASGGGRNDLETMKRSVPLHYSDLFDGGSDDYQNKTRMTQSLFAWFPYFKNENHADGLYNWRMNFAPWSNLRLSSVMSKEADWDTLRQVYDEYDHIKGYFYSDYYQLTPYSTAEDRWNGWEFYDPQTKSGYASLSCNPACSTLSRSFLLKGLDADTIYTVTDFDGLVDITATGRELMENGLTVTVPESSYCVILMIQSKK